MVKQAGPIPAVVKFSTASKQKASCDSFMEGLLLFLAKSSRQAQSYYLVEDTKIFETLFTAILASVRICDVRNTILVPIRLLIESGWVPFLGPPEHALKSKFSRKSSNESNRNSLAFNLHRNKRLRSPPGRALFSRSG